MFQLVLLSCVVLTSAFLRPAVTSNARQLLLKSYENEVGAISPVGYFDPLSLAKDDETFRRNRECEVKHGRAAMLGVLGYVVPEIYRFPGGFVPGGKTFSEFPNGIAAIEAIPALGWIQIFFLIGFLDYTVWKQDPEKAPGDVGFGAIIGEDEEKVRNNEVNNGRLAMVACLELFRHDSQNLVAGVQEHLITGLPFLYK